MDFCEKLPRSKKEFALFIAVISVLSVNIIAPLITCFEFGFSLAVWAYVLTVIPFIWLSVVALVLLTYRPAQWLTDRICAQGDSFRARDGEHTVHRAADVGLSDGDRHLDRQPQPDLGAHPAVLLQMAAQLRAVSRRGGAGGAAHRAVGHAAPAPRAGRAC